MVDLLLLVILLMLVVKVLLLKCLVLFFFGYVFGSCRKVLCVVCIGWLIVSGMVWLGELGGLV